MEFSYQSSLEKNSDHIMFQRFSDQLPVTIWKSFKPDHLCFGLKTFQTTYQSPYEILSNRTIFSKIFRPITSHHLKAFQMVTNQMVTIRKVLPSSWVPGFKLVLLTPNMPTFGEINFLTFKGGLRILQPKELALPGHGSF